MAEIIGKITTAKLAGRVQGKAPNMMDADLAAKAAIVAGPRKPTTKELMAGPQFSKKRNEEVARLKAKQDKQIAAANHAKKVLTDEQAVAKANRAAEKQQKLAMARKEAARIKAQNAAQGPMSSGDKKKNK